MDVEAYSLERLGAVSQRHTRIENQIILKRPTFRKFLWAISNSSSHHNWMNTVGSGMCLGWLGASCATCGPRAQSPASGQPLQNLLYLKRQGMKESQSSFLPIVTIPYCDSFIAFRWQSKVLCLKVQINSIKHDCWSAPLLC